MHTRRNAHASQCTRVAMHTRRNAHASQCTRVCPPFCLKYMREQIHLFYRSLLIQEKAQYTSALFVNSPLFYKSLFMSCIRMAACLVAALRCIRVDSLGSILVDSTSLAHSTTRTRCLRPRGGGSASARRMRVGLYMHVGL